MPRRMVLLALTLLGLNVALPNVGAATTSAPRIVVHFAPELGDLRGRLLVFLTQLPDVGAELIEPRYLHPRDVEIAATEVDERPAGSSLEIPLDADAYPTPLAALAPGRYRARAELDVGHRYSYDGGQPDDPTSSNVDISLAPGVVATIEVDGRRGEPEHAADPAGVPGGVAETFVSPALSAFAGFPVTMDAYVAPPRAYASSGRRYASVYVIGGFGTSRATLPELAAGYARAARASGGGDDLIYVFLDPHVELGHSAFADSRNTGPWGQALTTEFIPYLESHWRMTATESTRFLTGHSSGGWASLWLQTTYPSIFGGSWSTAPDPLDFHDFTGPDLVGLAGGNFYADASGKPYMLVRDGGKDVVALRDYVLQERALGTVGGQFASFDAVFSPRGRDGRPQPLFDRATGRIDPAVAAAWESRYDIVHNLERDWPRVGPQLRGKLHVFVGSWDTFHLEAGVIRLQAVLRGLPASGATVEIVPRRDHFDLYAGPRGGLAGRFDREMRAAAAQLIPKPAGAPR